MCTSHWNPMWLLNLTPSSLFLCHLNPITHTDTRPVILSRDGRTWNLVGTLGSADPSFLSLGLPTQPECSRAQSVPSPDLGPRGLPLRFHLLIEWQSVMSVMSRPGCTSDGYLLCVVRMAALSASHWTMNIIPSTNPAGACLTQKMLSFSI